MVEFISYSGTYPNLCRGILKVKVNGVLYTFGDYDNLDKDNYFSRFWESGGEAGIDSDSQSYCYGGPWQVDTYLVDKLPSNFNEIEKELIKCFNDNVEHGCCGGCI